MIRRWLDKFALWILGGRYVPAEEIRFELITSRGQTELWKQRALRAEASIAELSRHDIQKMDTPEPSPQMIDIRVPRKVLR